MQSLTWFLALAGCLAFAQAHTYHMGACPIVEPMQGFQMNRVSGIFYIYQGQIKEYFYIITLEYIKFVKYFISCVLREFDYIFYYVFLKAQLIYFQ